MPYRTPLFHFPKSARTSDDDYEKKLNRAWVIGCGLVGGIFVIISLVLSINVLRSIHFRLPIFTFNPAYVSIIGPILLFGGIAFFASRHKIE